MNESSNSSGRSPETSPSDVGPILAGAGNHHHHQVVSQPDSNENKRLLDSSNVDNHLSPKVEATGGGFAKDAAQQKVKAIGLVQGFSMVVGCIVGSGIFISVGATMSAAAPSLGIVLILWTFGALVSLFGGLSYVELGMMLTKSGGERTYLTEAFGSKIGATFTIVYVFMVKTITLAAVSITFGTYFVEIFLPNCHDTVVPQKLVAASMMLTVFLINSASTKLAANTQTLFTVIKMSALVLIIVLGIRSFAVDKPRNEFHNMMQVSTFDVMALLVALINVFWSMEGWNSLGPVVGEMINPKRDLLISIGTGIPVVLAFYLLVIVAYVQVLGYSAVQMTPTVAMAFAIRTMGRFSWIIPMFICCSTFGAANGNLLSVARIVLMSGYEGELPSFLGLVHRTSRTPINAMFVIMCITMGFLCFEFQQLLGYCAFISWMFYFLTMSALFKLRFKRPDLVSTFRVPLFCPVVLMLVACFIVGMSFKMTPIGCSGFLIAIIVTFSMQFLPRSIFAKMKITCVLDKLTVGLEACFNMAPCEESDIS